MNRLIIILFLLVGTVCMGQVPTAISGDYIRIDHVGPIDKPIGPYIISTGKLDVRSPELGFQVSEDVFSSIVNYITTSKDLKNSKEIDEFGVFRISKVIKGKKSASFTPDRITSIIFFKEFKNSLPQNDSAGKLMEGINYILLRIDSNSK